MALQYERNVNLEEVDSDALFGIPYLAHQTFVQKVIFLVCIGTSISIFLVTQLFFGWSSVASIAIAFALGGVGFLFGANQNEHLTIAQYLVLILFKPVKHVPNVSTEDIINMKPEAKEIEEEQKRKRRLEEGATEEGQRKLLRLLIGMMVGFIIFILVLFGVVTYKNSHIEHHTVGVSVETNLKG